MATASDNRIEYNQTCPECKTAGVTSNLGFDLDAGKIKCNGNPAHEFENMPGEPAPIKSIEAESETNQVEDSGEGVSAAADEKRFAELREKTTRQQPEEPAQVERDPAPPVLHVDAAITPASVAGVGPGEIIPLVGECGVTRLPGGDILCGVRISEEWAIALQSEGEDQKPAKTAAEVLQERINLGLLEWYQAAPTAR